MDLRAFTIGRAIDSGGGVLFLLVAVLAARRAAGRRSMQLLAAASGLYGLTFALRHVVRLENWGEVVFFGAAFAFAGIGFLAYAGSILGRLEASERRSFAASTGVLLAGYVGGIFASRDPSVPLWRDLYDLAYVLGLNFMALAMIGVVVAAALLHRRLPVSASRARRFHGLSAIAFGGYALWYLAPSAESLPWLGIPFVGAVAATSIAWLGATRDHEPRLARNVLLTLCAFATASLLYYGVVAPTYMDGQTSGTSGIVRTMTAAALAWAILRFDEGSDESRRYISAVRLAGLAALFVVAEVAQNFLSAEYGLLMGGIVAGALFFAARPIERALERRQPAGAPVAKERSFLAAARRFHRNGTITHEEERELMILAEHLGIPASRAYELRDEVQREA